MAPFGTYRHRALLETENLTAPPAPDGSWPEAWAPLEPPDWACAIRPATARDLETIGAGTVLGQATHVCRGRFHKGITLKTRLTVRDSAGLVHTMSVVGVINPDLRCLETEIVCTEMVS